MQKAFSRTFSTICASSLTTIGGFLALICMKFGIGADLGIVLAKGVLMSLLTRLFLQPCIMLFLAKPMEKTKHPVYLPKFQKSANFAVKARKPIIVIFLIALIPVLYCGLNISYSYMKMDKGNKQPTEVEQIVEVMGNSILICAPNGKSADTHTKFIKDIKKFEEVEVVSSIYAMLPKDMPIVSDIMLKQVHQMIENNAPELKAYANNKYVLYTVMISTKSESKEEQLLLAKIQGVLTKHFGEDYYITGMAQAVNDLATITPKDFALVSVVSAVIIFIILMFTIKSFKYSLALMGVIEFGIYVNLGICFLANTPVNFMAYIIISSVQLGATIDYAILLAMEFKRKMQTMSIKTACASAVQNSSLPICISAIILSALCYAVSLISSNAIIGQITMLIANGAVISALLILFVLPSVLLAITHKVPKEIDFKQLIKRKKKQKKYNT